MRHYGRSARGLTPSVTRSLTVAPPIRHLAYTLINNELRYPLETILRRLPFASECCHAACVFIADSIDEKSWAGGLLVTDEHGLPVDFRYVEPIKPSKLQKLIYGDALRRCLVLDAIAGTLLKAANPRVAWMFAADPLMLDLDGRVGGPIVAIGNGEKDPLSEVGAWRLNKIGEIAMQVSQTGPPARLTFLAKDEHETKEKASELSRLAVLLNFIEPLDRVGAALKEICGDGT